MSVPYARVLTLRGLLREQLLHALRNPDETLFKEVWEQCEGEEEIAVVDQETARVISTIEEMNP